MPIIREKQSSKQTNKTLDDRVDNNTIHAKPRFHYIIYQHRHPDILRFVQRTCSCDANRLNLPLFRNTILKYQQETELSLVPTPKGYSACSYRSDLSTQSHT